MYEKKRFFSINNLYSGKFILYLSLYKLQQYKKGGKKYFISYKNCMWKEKPKNYLSLYYRCIK